MKICTPDQARHIGPQAHRGGGISFRHLLQGVDDARDNYSLSLVRVEERYEAVRHRHNFDQVRIVLEGRFGFGPGAVQAAGSIGYFCEGSYYTQLGEGPSLTLLLQCGGASGSGYMSFERLQRGIGELQARGRFHDGVYTWIDAAGCKHNLDGYEAVWSHVNGRPLHYPKPRYQAPIILWPDRFGAQPVAHGVQLKPLGQFNERGLGIAQWLLEGGASLRLPAATRRELLYVQQGGLSVASQALPAGSAIEVAAGESLHLVAAGGGALLLGLSLPHFG